MADSQQQIVRAVDRRSQARFWTDPETYATTLLILFRDAFGQDPEPMNDGRSPFGWDPETIELEIYDTWGVAPGQLNVDRLMAALKIATDNDFFQNPDDFVMLCNVLAGTPVDPVEFDPADVLEIAWGITEAMIIGPPGGDEPFSDEVRAYIGQALDDEGIVHPPDVLRIAIRDNPDTLPQVQSDFADDPDLFSAVYKRAEDRSREIDELIRTNVLSLISQLDGLDLANGNTRNICRRMASAMAAVSTAGSEDA